MEDTVERFVADLVAEVAPVEVLGLDRPAVRAFAGPTYEHTLEASG
jgi:hypothetical protein